MPEPTEAATNLIYSEGFADALGAFQAWAKTEDAARAVHAAWLKGMQDQYRPVDRHRQKWVGLDPEDQLLDQHIAQQVVLTAVEQIRERMEG